MSSGADGIEGRVLEDHNGSPLASAGVRLFRVGQAKVAADLQTDRDGRFRAPGLPPGDYVFEIGKSDFVSETARASVAAGTALVFRLVRSAVVSGQAMDDQGRPLTGAHVFVLSKADLTSTVDDRGGYRLSGLTPGQYQIALRYGTGGMLYPKVFAVSGGEELRADFTVATTGVYSVVGRVLLPGPRTRMTAALTPVDQPALAVATATPDDYGRLQFPRVPTGSYNLLVTGPPVGRGSSGATLENEVYFARTHVDVAGQNVEALLVEVQRGRTARFQLSPAAGCPASARLTLAPLEDWGGNVERSFEINSAQPTVVEDLAPTRFRMNVTGAGTCFGPSEAIADLTGPGESKPYTVAIGPPGSLRGKVTGAAAAGEFAVVLVAGAEPVRIVIPDVDGRFAFDNLPPGHYRIAAQTSGARWVGDVEKMFDVEVTSGAPLELDLPAPVAHALVRAASTLMSTHGEARVTSKTPPYCDTVIAGGNECFV